MEAIQKLVFLLAAFVQLAVMTTGTLTEVRLGVLLMTSENEPFDLRRIRPAMDIAFNISEQVYGIK